MNNGNQQPQQQPQRCSNLDDIFGTAKAVSSTIDGIVDVSRMAYQQGSNVINNAFNGYQQQQQSSFFDNSSRRNQQQFGNVNGNPYQQSNVTYNNYGYPYGNIGNPYQQQMGLGGGLFNNNPMGNNYGYPGISNPSYGMIGAL